MTGSWRAPGPGRQIRVLAFLLASIGSSHAELSADSSHLPAGIELIPPSSKTLSGWTEKSFKGHTRYTLTNINHLPVIHASSQNSASGLYRNIDIDLDTYPYLNWRWRIDARLNTGDETSKAGDDFAARVYVIIEHDFLFWKTRALCYVWANGKNSGDSWNNPFAGQSVNMLAIRSNNDQLGTWFSVKRNIKDDLRLLLGENHDSIDSVAIMVDTDNSHGRASTYFADMFFSAE